ncbi:MAG: 50S ribosomal protein L34e [Candidatus Bathyarchaeia archaeon]
MPKPHLRTRSRKRQKTKLPGGRSQVHYKRKKTPAPSCFICGQPLAGIPKTIPSKMRKLNRSKRRIWRPFGGQICHNCLQNALKQAARTI